MEPDYWTSRDTVRLTIFLVAILFSTGALVMACQSDMKRAEQRKECIAKGGVWFRDESLCLDLKTLPIKEQ